MLELPHRPNLEQLRKQAKDLHRAHRAGDPSCCSTLRWLSRFAKADDALILGSQVSLQEVQHALAMDYGFVHWASMRNFVTAATDASAPHPSLPPEMVDGWQAITDLLAELLRVPAALIMRLHPEDITVLVSSDSPGNPYSPGDTEKVWDSGLYCEHVIKTRELLLVPNAIEQRRWMHNPDIALGMISYMGLPIIGPTGSVFGTVCVLDNRTNPYSEPHKRLLGRMRDCIEDHLRLHHARQLEALRFRQLHSSLATLRNLTALVPICSICHKVRDDEERWQSLEAYFAKADVSFSHGVCPDCVHQLE
jgi:hypothetical protein